MLIDLFLLRQIYKMDPEMFEKYKADLKRIEEDEMPEKRELKDYLGDCYKNLKVYSSWLSLVCDQVDNAPKI